MKKILKFVVSLLLVIAIIASIGWYLFVYDRDFTRDTLLSQARYHDLHGNSRISAWFYDMAYEYSGRDENVAIELANQYKANGNYTKAEVTLSKAIHAGGTVELYTALCKVYAEQDKLLDAVNMLSNVSNPAIKAQLDQMRPTAPAGDYEPGFYSQYIDVTLSSSSGTLYCTTDGDYPSILDEPYSQPITLPSGETTIYAIAVDESGLVSPLTILGYTVGGVVEPASFADSAMENAMRAALEDKSSNLIYTDDLWTISSFTVPEGVKDFSDLEMLPYVRSLTINNYTLPDLDFLSTLTRLENLDLSNCQFPPEALKVIAELPSLTNLNISHCGLSTISGLENATKLTHLDASKNNIRNLDPIRDITSLLEINLMNNAVIGLEALGGLYHLENLNIAYNSVTDLSPLQGCSRLTRLDASNNLIAQVSGIGTLPLLSYLSLDYNQITDISSLSGCQELTELHVANNQIYDISVVGTLLKLDVLDFAYNQVTALPTWADGCVLRTIDGSQNQITTIDSLAQLEQISYVYMEYNALTSIDALADCYHLVQVNVFGNAISDVHALTDHNIIVNYDPT